MQSAAEVVAEEQVPAGLEISGQLSDEELAAVSVVLQAALAGASAPEQTDDRPLAGGWKTYLRAMRRTPPPGREAWRFSARP